MQINRFKTSFAQNIANQKYLKLLGTWDNLSEVLIDEVCGTMHGTLHPILGKGERDQLVQYLKEMKFIPGGRYLAYSGRPLHAWNNCFLLRAEDDTREEWGELVRKAMLCLTYGGGIGIDYSILRESGRILKRTGGAASGPLPLMYTINELGRNVMQGGSRRSAIYASLHWQHGDIPAFLKAKNWNEQLTGLYNYNKNMFYSMGAGKRADFNFPCPLDMTNISLNYDDAWLNLKDRDSHPIFLENCKQALSTGEPGFSFNFGDKQKESLRNAPVSADTWVMTKTGYRQIAEIVDKEVTVWTGKRWAATKFRKTRDSVGTIEIEMTGKRSIKADPTHEFLVERWKGAGEHRKLVRVDRVPANALEVGDVLHVSYPQEPLRDEPLDVAHYTYGFTFGDGSFCKKYESRAEITFCSPSKLVCLETIRGYPLRSIKSQDKRGYIRVNMTDEWFVGKTKEVFPDVGVAHIPSFIAGLFDSDGSYDNKQSRVRLSCKHLSFLEGTRRALELIGIMSHINVGANSGYTGNPTYMLVIAGSSVQRFKEIVPTKRLKVSDFTPYRDAKIKVTKVQDGPIEDVFCCDVGAEEHSFCAEGVIISNCCEITSEDDSDVCNLASINLGNIKDLEELKSVVCLASKFLVCGTVRADLPYEKVYKIREKNRRLGLGLMGVHEWLLQRGYKYEVTQELHKWLKVYTDESEKAANEHCDRLYLSRPVAYRAVAPTGSIALIASTTTGIEPLFAVAYKRRYVTEGTKWKYEFVVDAVADHLIKSYDVKPEDIDTAYKLSLDYERRIKFQADVQDYVDMSISSTINLPSWFSEGNNPDKVAEFATALSKYSHRLRGFTCYPDGSRGGQPITEIDYSEALKHKGVVYQENDVCEITGKGGTCGS